MVQPANEGSALLWPCRYCDFNCCFNDAPGVAVAAVMKVFTSLCADRRVLDAKEGYALRQKLHTLHLAESAYP